MLMDDYNFPLFIEFELQLQFAQNCEIIFHFTFFLRLFGFLIRRPTDATVNLSCLTNL